jgi:hypothetical protein
MQLTISPLRTSLLKFIEGCVLLVKLHQSKPGDNQHVVIQTDKTQWSPGIGGLEVMPLHSFQG